MLDMVAMPSRIFNDLMDRFRPAVPIYEPPDGAGRIMHFVLDKHDNVIEIDYESQQDMWMAWHADNSRTGRMIVGRTYVGEYIGVSTVFIGIALNKDSCFETKVLCCRDNKVTELSTYEQTYGTWRDAKKGHKSVVKAVQRAIRHHYPEYAW